VLNSRRMQPLKRQFLCAAVLLAAVYSAAALTTIAPLLTNAVRSGDQFQFTLRGQTNVPYIVETSSDLRTWMPAVTNSDTQPTRTVVVPSANRRGFWRVRPVPGPLFEYAVAAQGSVNLGGSGRIDSFDSSDPNYSTDGRYDVSKQKAGGNIATASRAAGAVNVGNMKIAGVASTGPGASVMVSRNGSVGSLAWLYDPSHNGMIEPGYVRNDFQVVLPEAKLPDPFGPALFPTAGTVGGTNYTYVFENADYIMPSLSLASSQKAIIVGFARVYVRGSVSISGQGHLIVPLGASLELYVGGTNAVIGGTGIINSGNATKFMYFGLPANTNISVSGSAPFVGTIYAPNAGVTLTGTSDAVGAVVCTSFTLSGTMGLHFDENLKRVGPFY
jgi:hypothetical protein